MLDIFDNLDCIKKSNIYYCSFIIGQAASKVRATQI